MLRQLIWIGGKWGAAVGAAAGLFVGVVVGIFAALTTTTRIDLVMSIANGFWLLAVILPLFFYLNATINPDTSIDRVIVQSHLSWVALLAWLTASMTAVIFFMMPITMTPIIFNKGVSFETVNDWYRQVFDAVLGVRFLGMATLALVGFMAGAYAQQRK
jgi:hypothetical protein